MDELDSPRIAQVVSAYLHNCHPGGATLEVDESEVHKVRGQWYVPIHPSVEPIKRYEYYEALTHVEMALDEQEHLNVFLVPSDPKRAQAAETERQGAEKGAPLGRSAEKPQRRRKAARQAGAPKVTD